MAAAKDYPRIIQLLRKGGKGGRAKFQAGMELLRQVETGLPQRNCLYSPGFKHHGDVKPLHEGLQGIGASHS